MKDELNDLSLEKVSGGAEPEPEKGPVMIGGFPSPAIDDPDRGFRPSEGGGGGGGAGGKGVVL